MMTGLRQDPPERKYPLPYSDCCAPTRWSVRAGWQYLCVTTKRSDFVSLADRTSGDNNSNPDRHLPTGLWTANAPGETEPTLGSVESRRVGVPIEIPRASR